MYEDFISKRLTQLRMQKGVSARDMSLTIGQADNYINSIENKKAFPSMTVFFYICEYLEITPKEFFDEDTTAPTLLNELMDELRPLSETALSHMLGFVREMRDK